MGIGLNWYLERKNSPDKWVWADEIACNNYIDEKITILKEDNLEDKKLIKSYFDYINTKPENLSSLYVGGEFKLRFGDTNYQLLSMLAKIRPEPSDSNKFYIKPFDLPRGLPKNISDIVNVHYKSWSNVYSESWISLSEFFDYPWFRKNYTTAYVNEYFFLKYYETGFPICWYKKPPEHILLMSEPEAQLITENVLIERGNEYKNKEIITPYLDGFITKISFSWSPAQCVGEKYINKLLEWLKTKFHSESLNDIRIVFWFNN